MRAFIRCSDVSYTGKLKSGRSETTTIASNMKQIIDVPFEIWISVIIIDLSSSTYNYNIIISAACSIVAYIDVLFKAQNIYSYTLYAMYCTRLYIAQHHYAWWQQKPPNNLQPPAFNFSIRPFRIYPCSSPFISSLSCALEHNQNVLYPDLICYELIKEYEYSCVYCIVLYCAVLYISSMLYTAQWMHTPQ